MERKIEDDPDNHNNNKENRPGTTVWATVRPMAGLKGEPLKNGITGSNHLPTHDLLHGRYLHGVQSRYGTSSNAATGRTDTGAASEAFD
ncbi:hypothetical protein ZHAS_00018270 [Anopheles sinensis]|uniref:Uncharacterized protein n=1 Tax=Anopheles sinensis TaxID=74873 RepID=A0A084WHL3_ANOSI|nr:hypothetical protein ZHAS_00018270 [Anopheles sinensis]